MVLRRQNYRQLLILLVLCSLLCGVLAATATRSLKSVNPYSSFQDTAGGTQVWRIRSSEESNVREGRIDVELTDYSDPGANPGHEPATPPQG